MLEPLGLYKIDFVQGSMVLGEEDQSSHGWWFFIFWGWLKYETEAM